MPRFALVGLAVLAAGSGLAAPSARPLRLDETVEFAGIEDLRLSPDGRMAAFCVRRRAAGENRFTTDIHVVPAEGSAPERALTRAPGNDCTPRFSPDGRMLAFVSDRSGSDQVWIMPVDGGEPVQVTRGEGIGTFAWLGNGAGIVFTAPAAPSEEERRRRERGDDARVYGEWPLSSLWLTNLPGQPGSRAGGTGAAGAIRLTDATMHVTDLIAPSPDGTQVAFVAQPNPEADASEEATVKVMEIATRSVRDVPGSRRASALAWPGKSLQAKRGGSPALTLLFARPFDGAGWSRADLFAWTTSDIGGPRNLSAAIDRDIEQILVDGEGAADVLWSRGAVSEIAAVGEDGSLGQAWSPLYPVGSTVRRGMERLFVRLDRPHEVWRADRSGRVRPITRLNAALTGRIDLPALETFRFKSGEWEVEGVLTVPPAAAAASTGSGAAAAASPRDGPYPLLVRPHGGPRSQSLLEFSPHDAWLASLGYLVFEPNFRGSTGYGDRFAKGNGGDWGAGPFADIMAGVDALVASGRADPKRLYLFGWSYGGILANWAATHSDRFRAIVSGAGVADLRMQYILSDARRWRFDYFGGSPFEPRHLPVYWANSPVTEVGKVATPVLFIQGEEDKRCPLPQALMMHRAILDNGGDSTLVLYPREGHGFRAPEHLLDRTRRIADFFAAHGGQPVPDADSRRAAGTR